MKVKELYTGRIVRLNDSIWVVREDYDAYIFSSTSANIHVSKVEKIGYIGVVYRDSQQTIVDNILMENLIKGGMRSELEKLISNI